LANPLRKWSEEAELRIADSLVRNQLPSTMRSASLESYTMENTFFHLSATLRSLLLVFLLLLFGRSGAAQDWAKPRLEKSPRHAEWVEIKQGDRTIKAFIVYPQEKKKTPVVLVIHEIFGLTDWVRGVCDQLAENGVIAIAPDLLSGQTFADVDGARKAISALPQEQIKAHLDATTEYALKLPASNGSLAVCGFCWGGSWAFGYANENPKLKAAYSFYGTAPDEASEVKNIPCPVYGFYAENDARVNATIPKSEALMRDAGKKYEAVSYKGSGHGFMRDGEAPDGTAANKQAREDAWQRWKMLLGMLSATQ
jgi:carboxymethylenebutenolidase